MRKTIKRVESIFNSKNPKVINAVKESVDALYDRAKPKKTPKPRIAKTHR